MKLYKVDTPVKCDIEECDNNAVLIVRTDEGTGHAVCPAHVLSMSVMNSENAEFFGQKPLQGVGAMDKSERIETAVDAIVDLILDDNNVDLLDCEGASVSPETWLAVKARLLALLEEMS